MSAAAIASPETIAEPIDYDPLDNAYVANPFPMYARLREEAPLHRGPKSGVYCLSRWEDVERAFNDPETFSSESAYEEVLNFRSHRFGVREVVAAARFAWRARLNPLHADRILGNSMLMQDAPRHSRLRNIVNRGFTPRRIADWEPRTREITDELLANARQTGRIEVVSELGSPLPLRLIAELLGVDPERQSDLTRLADTFVAAGTGSGRGDTVRLILGTYSELIPYVRDLAARRRRDPEDDLISVLVDPSLGETLDDHALFGFVTVLILAGTETTRNLIGNATSLLLDHPDQLALVLEDPARIPAMIEEVLRLRPSLLFQPRRVTQDTEVSGGKLRAGDHVVLLTGAANRDANVYEDADRFDVLRKSHGHLSFGRGSHFCLGASLARLEALVAFENLVPMLDGARRVDHERGMTDSAMAVGPTRVEIEGLSV